VLVSASPFHLVANVLGFRLQGHHIRSTSCRQVRSTDFPTTRLEATAADEMMIGFGGLFEVEEGMEASLKHIFLTNILDILKHFVLKGYCKQL